jgi:hypothetical protein
MLPTLIGAIACGGAFGWGGGHAKISTQALTLQPQTLRDELSSTTLTILGQRASAASLFGTMLAEMGDDVAGPCSATPCSAAQTQAKMLYREFCYAEVNGDVAKPWPYAIPVCSAGGSPPAGWSACLPGPKINTWLYHCECCCTPCPHRCTYGSAGCASPRAKSL